MARCPACGAERPVPRLGELAKLDVAAAEPAAPSGRGWNAGRAWLLAGIVAAISGSAVAVGLRWARAGVAPIDEAGIRAAVAAAPIDEVLAAWRAFERHGIDRRSSGEEDRRKRHAQSLQDLERVAWWAAAAGLVAAGAGAAMAAGGRRTGAAASG